MLKKDYAWTAQQLGDLPLAARLLRELLSALGDGPEALASAETTGAATSAPV